MITKENIESYIIDYIDGELTTAQTEALESYLTAHPEAATLLQYYQHTVSLPENISYPAVDSLLKKPSKTYNKYWKWGSAILVAAIGASLLYLNHRTNINAERNHITTTTHNAPPTPIQTIAQPIISKATTAVPVPIAQPNKVMKKTLATNHLSESSKPTVNKPIQKIDKINDLPTYQPIPYTIEIKMQYIDVEIESNKDQPTQHNIDNLNYPFKNSSQLIQESVEQFNNIKEKITESITNLKPTNIINEE